MIAIFVDLPCNKAMSDSEKEWQMTAKFLLHPVDFDARSVMLFASIALGSAFAQARPAPQPNPSTTSGAHISRVVQVERNLVPNDPRQHLQRQPIKKNL